MAAENAGLFGNPYFWIICSTAIFAGVAFKYGKKPLLEMLDGRSARIKAELDEAERLRIEAQDLLAECQRKHRDAIQTSQKIIDGARQTAERLRKDAEKKLEETMKRREDQFLARIARAETAAVQDLRDQAADIAARTAEKLLQDHLQKGGAKLVDDAIRELPARVN